jgi:hypothetical protein
MCELKEKIIKWLEIYGCFTPRENTFSGYRPKDAERALQEIITEKLIDEDKYFTLYRIGIGCKLPFCTFTANQIIGVVNTIESLGKVITISMYGVNYDDDKFRVGTNRDPNKINIYVKNAQDNSTTASFTLSDDEYADIIKFLTKNNRYDILIKLNS